MTELIEWLEARGRRGGALALLGCLAAAAVAGLILGWSWLGVDPEATSRWLLGGARFVAVLLGGAAMTLGVLGARLLTQKEYPSPAEVFPPLPVAELVVALQSRSEDVCVCLRCRVVLPSTFSTGACPVCASSVEYHEISDDEDVRIVIAALT